MTKTSQAVKTHSNNFRVDSPISAVSASRTFSSAPVDQYRREEASLVSALIEIRTTAQQFRGRVLPAPNEQTFGLN